MITIQVKKLELLFEQIAAKEKLINTQVDVLLTLYNEVGNLEGVARVTRYRKLILLRLLQIDLINAQL
jgi:hypothetical protein